MGDLPRSYRLLEIEVPDDILIENLEKFADLPEDWAYNQTLTQKLGDFWLERNSAALLEVPSALAPHTSNFLVNPAHPDAAKIIIASAKSYRIDERLLR